MFGYSKEVLDKICTSLKSTKELQLQDAENYKKQATNLKQVVSALDNPSSINSIISSVISSVNNIYKIGLIQNSTDTTINVTAQNKEKIENKIVALEKLAVQLTNSAEELEKKRKKFVEAGELSEKAVSSTKSLLNEKSALIAKTASLFSNTSISDKTGETGNTNAVSSKKNSSILGFFGDIIKKGYETVKTGAKYIKEKFSSALLPMLVGGVTSIISGGKKFFENLKTGAKFGEKITSALVTANNKVSEIVGGIVKKAGNVITGAKKVVGSVTKSVVGAIEGAVEGAKKFGSGILTGAKKIIGSVTKSLVPIAGTIVDTTFNLVGDVANKVISQVPKAWDKITGAVKSTGENIKSLVTNISGIAGDIANKATGAVKTIKDNTKPLIEKIGGKKISEIGKKLPGKIVEISGVIVNTSANLVVDAGTSLIDFAGKGISFVKEGITGAKNTVEGKVKSVIDDLGIASNAKENIDKISSDISQKWNEAKSKAKENVKSWLFG